MRILSLSMLLLILLSSSITIAATIHVQSRKYVDMIGRLGGCYRHVLDDLCGMMDIALKFRDDPQYNYDPSDMEMIIMRDGVNGTQELIDLYNEFMNAIQTDLASLENATGIKIEP